MKKKHKEHPLVAETIGQLREADEGSYAFVSSDLVEIRGRAEQVSKAEELYQLISEVCMFAKILDTKHASPDAARALLDELAEPLAEELLRRVDETSSADAARAQRARQSVAKQREALSQPGSPLSGLAPSSGGLGVGLRKKR